MAAEDARLGVSVYGEPWLHVLRAWRVLRATLSLAVSAEAFGRSCCWPQYLHLRRLTLSLLHGMRI